MRIARNFVRQNQFGQSYLGDESQTKLVTLIQAAVAAPNSSQIEVNNGLVSYDFLTLLNLFHHKTISRNIILRSLFEKSSSYMVLHVIYFHCAIEKVMKEESLTWQQAWGKLVPYSLDKTQDSVVAYRAS